MPSAKRRSQLLLVRLVFQCALGKGQTAITIPTQASDSGGSGFLKFQAKGGEGLVGLVSALLGEEGLEFRFDRRLTLFGHGAEQVFALMGNTPWALRRGELEFNRIEHGLVAGGEPQVSLLKAAWLELFESVRPGRLILSLPVREAQDCAHARQRDANAGENGPLGSLAVLADAEGGASCANVLIAGGHGSCFPNRILRTQRVEQP